MWMFAKMKYSAKLLILKKIPCGGYYSSQLYNE